MYPSNKNILDVLIIGAGFAGLTCYLNLIIHKINVNIFDTEQNKDSYIIKNFPSIYKTNNIKLKEKIIKQIKKYNKNFTIENKKINIVKKNKYFITCTTEDNQIIKCKYLILAYGYQKKTIDIVNYTDLIYNKKIINSNNEIDLNQIKNIIIIGGGDSSFKYIEYIKKHNKNINIYILQRNRNLKMQDIYKEKIINDKMINIFTNTKILKINYHNLIFNSQGKIYNIEYNQIINATGILTSSNIEYINIYNKKIYLKYIKNNFVYVNKNYLTNIKNIYAIGIIVNPDNQQIINTMHSSFVASHHILEQLTGKNHKYNL